MTTTRIKPSNIDTAANYTFNQVTVSKVAANGSVGSSSQVLTSDASGNNYWAPGFTTGKAIAMSIVFGG